MATNRQAILPPITSQWVDGKGVPTIPFAQFVSAISENVIGPLVSAANDAAAAKAGVPINGLYQAGGIVRVRIT